MVRSRVLVVVVLALALLPPAASAARKDARIGRAWTHPEIASHGMQSIVILPAATWDGNMDASTIPSNVWLDASARTGHRWIPADEVVRHFSPRPRSNDSLVRSIQEQVRRSGRVDAATASALGRVFGAEGVLCLRVDRWDASLGGGSRYSATVELRCSLIDTAGTELWTMEGRGVNDGPLVAGPSIPAAPSTSIPQIATPSLPSSGQSGSGGSSSGSASSTGSGGGSGGSTSSGGSGSTSGSSGSSTPKLTLPAPQQLDETAVEGEKPDEVPIFQGALVSLYECWIPRFPQASRKPK